MSPGRVVQRPQHRGCHSKHLTLLHTAAFRSTKIMAVFESLVGKSHLERASIDEVLPRRCVRDAASKHTLTRVVAGILGCDTHGGSENSLARCYQW